MLDTEAYRQRIEDYATRLKQGVPASAIASDLGELLAEAETRAEYSDFQGALNQLMDYSSNLITDELRAALRDVRNK